MAQYIDKSALVAEIEELKNESKMYPSDFFCGRLSICKELMDFIDTLEVKEEIETKLLPNQQQDGLQWHPISEPMLPWHTCLLVHEKSYCIVRRHDDGRMFEITHNIEVLEGEPFHLIKWIDLAEIVKA